VAKQITTELVVRAYKLGLKPVQIEIFMYAGTTLVRNPVPQRIGFDFGTDYMGRVIRKCQVYPRARGRHSPFDPEAVKTHDSN
jgi:hypothetical protein